MPHFVVIDGPLIGREAEFLAMWAAYQAGNLPLLQLLRSMGPSRFRDSQGTVWMIDGSSGAWLFWDGIQWVPGTPGFCAIGVAALARPAPVPVDSAPSTHPPGARSRIPLFLGLAAGVAALGIGAFFLLGRGSETHGAVSGTTTTSSGSRDDDGAVDDTAETEPGIAPDGDQASAAATDSLPPPAGEIFPDHRVTIPMTSIATQPVTVSDADQTLRIDGTLTVTLPGGVVESATSLAVSRPSQPQPLPAPQLELIGDYEISVDDQKEFAKELTLTARFDPARLDPGLPARCQLVAAWWNPDREQWQRVPIAVDQAAGTVAIRTRHLSRWAIWYQVVRGFMVHEMYWSGAAGGSWVDGAMGELWDGETVWFRVFYDPNRDPPMAMAPTGGAKERPITPSSLVLATLVHAYDKYRAAGFRVPTGTFDVFIDAKLAGAATDSTFYGIDNIIFLPDPLQWENGEEPRMMVAHELFHTVQNRYLNASLSMTLRKWWMEATADYAAGKVAWDDVPSVWAYTIRFVKPWYPERSFRYFKDVDVGVHATPEESDVAATAIDPFQKHQYHTSVFVDYLVGTDRDHTRFKAIFEASAKAWILAAYSTAVEDAIDEYLRQTRAGKTLWDHWQQFVLEWYYLDGCASPMNPKRHIPEPRPGRDYQLAAGQDVVEVEVAADSTWGVSLLRVTTDADRVPCWLDGTVLPEGLEVYAVTSDGRCPGQTALYDVVGDEVKSVYRSIRAHGGQPVTLSPRAALYLLALNRGQAKAIRLPVRRLDWSLAPEHVDLIEGETAFFELDLRSVPANVKFRWSFGDDESAGVETRKPRISHLYEHAGSFAQDVTVAMVNPESGEEIDSRGATVSVRPKPKKLEEE